jgi:hypothetical protein
VLELFGEFDGHDTSKARVERGRAMLVAPQKI